MLGEPVYPYVTADRLIRARVASWAALFLLWLIFFFAMLVLAGYGNLSLPIVLPKDEGPPQAHDSKVAFDRWLSIGFAEPVAPKPVDLA